MTKPIEKPLINTTTSEYATSLAILRTKLANEATYLAYTRTCLAIAVIALSFKKYYIVGLGILMIIASTLEYYYISHHLNVGGVFDTKWFEILPIISTIIILAIFYVESKNIFKFKYFKFSKKMS